MTGKTETVTLTDPSSVRISIGARPVIASAEKSDSEYRQQANRKWTLIVREHDDGRRLVYGLFTQLSVCYGERDLHAGYLLAANSQDNSVACIHKVAERIGALDLADDCIADLPAEDLV